MIVFRTKHALCTGVLSKRAIALNKCAFLLTSWSLIEDIVSPLQTMSLPGRDHRQVLNGLLWALWPCVQEPNGAILQNAIVLGSPADGECYQSGWSRSLLTLAELSLVVRDGVWQEDCANASTK